MKIKLENKKLNFLFTKILIESYLLKEKLGSFIKGDSIYDKIVLKALEYILNTYKKNKYPVLASFFVPSELFHVFQVSPISCEYIAPLLAVSDKASSVLDATEAEGLSTDLCSFHRAVLGANLKGYLPRYKIVVATSHLCDGQNKTLGEIALREGIPFVLLDIPQINTKPAQDYLADQIKELYELLRNITGITPRKEDWEKVFYWSNKTRLLMKKVNHSRYHLKGDLFGQKAFNFTLLSWLMLGTEFLCKGFEELCAHLDQKAVKSNNTFKVVWLLSYPYYVGNFVEDIEGMGILGVADELSYVFWDALDPERPFESLAKKMLKNPHLGPIDNRLNLIRELVDKSKVDGVIHFSHWGCRQGCGGVKLIGDLLDDLNVPFLEIHGDCIDKRHRSKGQIKTRIQSFIELMSQKNTTTTKTKTSGFYLGIDVGSLTAKAVVLDSKRRVVYQKIIYTGSSTKKSISMLEKEIFSEPLFRGKIRGCISTGYGRFSVKFADENITEITCHAKGISYIIPKVRTLIDIGGQDTKVIAIGNNGEILKFVMNDKCAAGTGRFLEIMARALEIDIEDLGKLCMNSTKKITISSMCSVFAESEVISLIADNIAPEDIARGICNSIAKRTVALVERVGKIDKIAMSGGVAKNKGVIKELEILLGSKIHVPPEPQIIGALGAAIIATEKI